MTAIRKVTEELRDSHQAEGTQALAEVAEWTGANLLGLALRVLNSTQPYNLIVTNVPGPPMPLYLLDARMETLYPHLPLCEGQGLGIALVSYAGTLAWGLTGDWDLMALCLGWFNSIDCESVGGERDTLSGRVIL